VVAEVGTHEITLQQVDAKMQLQLYNARKVVIDKMIDDYLLQQAADKDGLNVSEYLKREAADKAAAQVTEATARKFYDENKDKLPALKSAGPFDKIKDRLVVALRQHAAEQKREDLLAGLRKQAAVKLLLEPPRIEVAASGHPSLGPSNAPSNHRRVWRFSMSVLPRGREHVEGCAFEIRRPHPASLHRLPAEFPQPLDAGRERGAMRRRAEQVLAIP
jgi:hypothetical protein